jgi:hypothetical protein
MQASFANVAAAVAIIISLMPYLIGALKRPKLKVTVQTHVFVGHYCGRPQMLAFLDIHNAGGRATTISQIDLLLERDGKRWDLRADSYVAQDVAARLESLIGKGREMLVGTITLQPGEHWREQVDAYDYPAPADEKLLNELSDDMDENIARQRSELPPAKAGEDATLIDVDAALVNRATEQFRTTFALLPGHYRLFVAVHFGDGKKLFVREFSFTLWDRPGERLRAVADSYRYGISYAHSQAKTVAVRLAPVDNGAKAAAEYKRLRGIPRQ